MPEPNIIIGGSEGLNNLATDAAVARLDKGRSYEDLSTVVLVPTRGKVPARVVETWMGLMGPMNNPLVRVFIEGMEVGEAYTAAIGLILDHEYLRDFKYVLTLEEDNMPPPDGLLKLYESIKDYVAVGGLYWTKGEDGQPMIYGNPTEILNFRPQMPVMDTVQECHGLGMGFTLFQMDVFRQIEPPWFRTVNGFDGGGYRSMTQDLFFFEKVRKAGFRVACDTRVRVGHLDPNTGIVW